MSNAPGQRTSGRRIRFHHRLSSLVVLLTFTIGVGPGILVQPCPKHAAIGSDSTAEVHTGHQGTPGDAASSGHHKTVEGGGSTTGHSDGPCDCLSECEECCSDGPSPVVGSVLLAAAGAGGGSFQVVPRGTPQTTRYLNPFPRPPPA